MVALEPGSPEPSPTQVSLLLSHLVIEMEVSLAAFSLA